MAEEITMQPIDEYPILYRRDASGRICTWQMFRQGREYWTTHGIEGGSMITSEPTVARARSQSTDEAQADFEVLAKYKLQREVKQYRDSRDRVDDASTYFMPMLAQVYAWKRVKTFLDAGRRLFVQRKLDGVRCIATREGLWTRKGKPIVSCDHVRRALEPMFEVDPDAVFDGELYNHAHRKGFDKLSGLIRRKLAKLSPPELELIASVVQYHVYDLPSVRSKFSDRWRALMDLEMSAIALTDFENRMVPTIQLVETVEVFDQEGFDEFHATSVSEENEGSVGRIDSDYAEDGDFENRTWHLQKRKDFEDAEFKLVRLEAGEGNWAGCARVAHCVDARGEPFKADVIGTKERCRELMSEEHGVVTVKFFGLTPARQVPRFGKVTKFHGPERVL